MQGFTGEISHSKEEKEKRVVSLEREASDLQLFCILASAESFFFIFEKLFPFCKENYRVTSKYFTKFKAYSYN